MYKQMKRIKFFTVILLATLSFQSVSCVKNRYVYEGPEECNEKENTCDCNVNQVNEKDEDGNVDSIVHKLACYQRPKSLYEASFALFRDVKRGFREVAVKIGIGFEYGKDRVSRCWSNVHEYWSHVPPWSEHPAWIHAKRAWAKTKAIAKECWNGIATLTDQCLEKIEKFLTRLRNTVN